jgi:hypothetical protein
LIISALLIPLSARTATNQTSFVLDGAGGRASGGTLDLVSAVAQPGGIEVSSDGSLVNYAGFLNTFSLRPGLDTDGDGVEDELDTDNDNDALEDLVEITGSGFAPVTPTDPNIADSDGDGAGDGEEAIAETNPWDDTMYLRLTGITGGEDVSVRWQARHGKSYLLYWTDDLATGLPGTYLDTHTANDATATPPWYETETSYDHLGGGADSRRSYYIRLDE